MTGNPRGTQIGRQAGFSMIEMLMAAVILAIGILGVTMLQVICLRGNGTSRFRTTADQLAERILDQVEEEGRNTWLNITIGNQYGGAGAVPSLLYFNGGTLPAVNQDFDVNGNPTTNAGLAIFHTATNGVAVPRSSSTGALADVAVTVTYTETQIKGTPITHTVVLTRRVVHA